jgi:hypothetical protein
MDQSTQQQLEGARDTLTNASRKIKGRKGHAKVAAPSFDAASENINRVLELAEQDPSIDTLEDLFPESGEEAW